MNYFNLLNHKLVIGTAQFGFKYGIANKKGIVSLEEGGIILEYAKENGVNMLDTSFGYGDSESKLGVIGVSEWQVVTKIVRVSEDKDIASQVEKNIHLSLNRLKINSLYGVLFHNPDQLLGQSGFEVYSALQKLKEEGIIGKIGISVYSTDELESLISNFDFDIVQAPFNLFDRRLSETGWLTKLASANIEVHIRSVFLQGLLLMHPADRPTKFGRWNKLWAAYDNWLLENNITALQACLNYVLDNPKINKCLVGIDSLENIQEIISAVNTEIPVLPEYLNCNDLELINPHLW